MPIGAPEKGPKAEGVVGCIVIVVIRRCRCVAFWCLGLVKNENKEKKNALKSIKARKYISNLENGIILFFLVSLIYLQSTEIEETRYFP